MPVLIDWVVSENEFANSADNSAQSKSKIWCNSVDLMRESTSFFLSQVFHHEMKMKNK